MPRHLLRRLRRSSVLLVLALCAWMALSSMAWAMPVHDDCCPSSMAMPHGSSDHMATHMSNLMSDSCCAHAPASVPESLLPHVLHVQADVASSQLRRKAAPQPLYEPPLRPPLA